MFNINFHNSESSTAFTIGLLSGIVLVGTLLYFFFQQNIDLSAYWPDCQALATENQALKGRIAELEQTLSQLRVQASSHPEHLSSDESDTPTPIMGANVVEEPAPFSVSTSDSLTKTINGIEISLLACNGTDNIIVEQSEQMKVLVCDFTATPDVARTNGSLKIYNEGTFLKSKSGDITSPAYSVQSTLYQVSTTKIDASEISSWKLPIPTDQSVPFSLRFYVPEKALTTNLAFSIELFIKPNNHRSITLGFENITNQKD